MYKVAAVGDEVRSFRNSFHVEVLHTHIDCMQFSRCIVVQKNLVMWSKECGKREKQTVATIELDAMH